MATKHYENGIIANGGNSDVLNDIFVTGDVIFVDSVNGNDANDGLNEKEPLATLQQAVTNATDENGDVIIVKENHAETLSTVITIDKNLRIYGQGSGSSKPALSIDASNDVLRITTDNVVIDNIRFPKGLTVANNGKVSIAGQRATVSNCDFECGEFDPQAIKIGSSGNYPTIKDCTFTVVENGPNTGILINEVTLLGLIIESCTFDGGDFNFDDSAVFSSVAHKQFYYKDNVLMNCANIIHEAASKGICTGTVVGDGSRVEV